MITLEQQIAVMQHYAEGGEVETRSYTHSTNAWNQASLPTWNWSHYEYRKKPKPITRYVNIYQNEDGYGIGSHLLYDTEKGAQGASSPKTIAIAVPVTFIPTEEEPK